MSKENRIRSKIRDPESAFLHYFSMALPSVKYSAEAGGLAMSTS